ncbi:MAG TPA: nucleoside-diphosphate kinase, partial [Gemmatimonadales bacterium]|nr:nucleoside-diphosphate kinase [Gemmatimonadales bacterium]
MGNQTLGIVKPDGIENGHLGNILAQLEREGYRIRAARLVRLSRVQAEAFYEVHRGRPFYEELVRFMSSGPCLPMALEKADAVAAFRASIGATDP